MLNENTMLLIAAILIALLIDSYVGISTIL